MLRAPRILNPSGMRELSLLEIPAPTHRLDGTTLPILGTPTKVLTSVDVSTRITAISVRIPIPSTPILHHHRMVLINISRESKVGEDQRISIQERKSN